MVSKHNSRKTLLLNHNKRSLKNEVKSRQHGGFQTNVRRRLQGHNNYVLSPNDAAVRRRATDAENKGLKRRSCRAQVGPGDLRGAALHGNSDASGGGFPKTHGHVAFRRALLDQSRGGLGHPPAPNDVRTENAFPRYSCSTSACNFSWVIVTARAATYISTTGS